jgi:phenylacetate-CoA oxygenase PaaH subunit
VIYEVFRQERKGQAFQHAGSVEAADERFAESYAREQYGRRGESVALWVVARDSIMRIEEFVDELILGWRDSEWTGIAPFLEEDVAFSSIAQNEVGHARALYELAARDLGTPADELAFDREPTEYRCSELVELRLPEWERTIARHVLYEQADAERLERLKAGDDAEVAGLAAKIDREEIYHRLHAEMWHERLKDEPRYAEALADLRPLVGRRNGHAPALTELWEEMTSVRRSQPAGTTW